MKITSSALPHELDDTLERVLAAQIGNARQRMQRGRHVYPEEYVEAVAAAAQVRRLRVDLDLGRFLRTLTPSSGKPRFLLVFAPKPEREVVLKAYGRRRAGELSLERLWNQIGVPAVEVIDGGNDPATWLLMQPIPTESIASQPLHGPKLLAVTRELARIMRDAHSIPWPASEDALLSRHGYRWFGPAVRRHLTAVLSTLAVHGYRVREDWERIVDVLAVHPRSVLLHGDLSMGNLLRNNADGGLRLLDAAAYLGPPEFDAARWVARTGGAGESRTALAAWLEVEPDLDAAYASELLGLELLMEAGVRELVKDEEAQELNFPDAGTVDLLTTADQLLERH